MRARNTASLVAPKTPASPRKWRGSVIVIVMVTLIFASIALVAFMDKASNDLLVEQRDAETRRLRTEAYSALETTLAVLDQFRQVGGGLHSPAEGWSDPLNFAGYTPTEDRTVEVSFEDESGKISLPRANAITLTNLFKNWELNQTDAEALADALTGWMKANHVYSTGLSPDYEQQSIPYEEPGRSLRSFQELAAIDKVREMFYDTSGQPNDLWKRFVASVSLFDFQRSNINGAKADTLAAIGQFDQNQQQSLTDYLNGTGSYQTQGPGYFQSPAEAQRITGPSGDSGALAADISALRILVTVHDGKSIFRLSAVIAPPNGATTVQTTATQQRALASPTSNGSAAAQQNRPNATQANNPTSQPTRQNAPAGANAGNLRYPFTLLEIRENDEIPPPPPPPPTQPV